MSCRLGISQTVQPAWMLSAAQELRACRYCQAAVSCTHGMSAALRADLPFNISTDGNRCLP